MPAPLPPILVATATGYAADLPHVPPQPVAFGGNLYLRGDVGVGIADRRAQAE